MTNNPMNDIRFVVMDMGHETKRPMILAKLNWQAVDMVCNIILYDTELKVKSLLSFRFANQRM